METISDNLDNLGKLANHLGNVATSMKTQLATQIVQEWTPESWTVLILVVLAIVLLLACWVYTCVSNAIKFFQCCAGCLLCNCCGPFVVADSRWKQLLLVFVQSLIIGSWVFFIVFLLSRLPSCDFANLRNKGSCGVSSDAQLSDFGWNIGLAVAASVAFLSCVLSIVPTLCGCRAIGCVGYAPRDADVPMKRLPRQPRYHHDAPSRMPSSAVSRGRSRGRVRQLRPRNAEHITELTLDDDWAEL